MTTTSTELSALAAAISPQRTVALFENVRINKLTLKNRIVMPPMTRTMSPGGVPATDRTRKLSGKPTISVGSVAMTGEHIDSLMGQDSGVAGIDLLLEMLDIGDFELVAVGRGLLMNPDWAQHVRGGRLDALKPWNREVLASLT